MRATAIFPLLLAAFVSCSQENDKFTLVSTRKLAGGKELHSIQEHLEADDLPELPSVPEEDDEIDVPVDEHGNILPGFEHLMDPKVIVINRDQLEKLNNSKPVNGLKPDGITITEKGPIEPYGPKGFVIPPIPVRPLDRNDIDEETGGTDYDEAAVPDLLLPTVQDYVDSKEKDPEVETATTMSEADDEDLQKIEALDKITQEIEEKKEDEKKETEDLKKEKENIQEDVNAIIKEAENEFQSAVEKEEKAEEEGLKELIKEISDDILDDKKPNEEKEEEEPKILIAGKVAPAAEDGEKGYVLDGTIDEETKKPKEEERRPSRIHKGEVIGRHKPKPDSARCQMSLTVVMIFFCLIFV